MCCSENANCNWGIPGSSAGGELWCYWTITLYCFPHSGCTHGWSVATQLRRWTWELAGDGRGSGDLPWHGGFLGHGRLWDACCRLPLLPVWTLHLLWWPVGANLSHEVSCAGWFVPFLQYVDHSKSQQFPEKPVISQDLSNGRHGESYPRLLWEHKPVGVCIFYRKNWSPKLQKGAAEWKKLNQWYQHNLYLPQQLRRHGAIRSS